jgi:hypothetical protein
LRVRAGWRVSSGGGIRRAPKVRAANDAGGIVPLAAESMIDIVFQSPAKLAPAQKVGVVFAAILA